MEQKEIEEGNKLIAEFMGLKKMPDGRYEGLYEKDYAIYPEDKLGYFVYWNWLMPVVEKICRLKIGDGVEYVDYAYPRTFGMINKETGKLMVRLSGYQCFEADTLIEAAWLAVVDFIKYNQPVDNNPFRKVSY